MSFDRELDAPTHDHVFLGERHEEHARRTLWVVAITAAMMVAEIVAGYAFNSMALLADGFHMATHAGALGVAAIAYMFARRHANDRSFTFGTGKVGDLAGFASALLLAGVAIGIGAESLLRLFQPGPVAFTEATVIAVVGLGVNLVSALLLSGGHGHAHPGGRRHAHAHDHDHPEGQDHEHGVHERDNNLRSALLHVLADALTSVLAIVALLAGSRLGILWLDPAIGLVGAVVISLWSWSLLRDTAAVLLDRSDPEIEATLRRRLAAVPGSKPVQIDDLHVWRIGPGAFAGIVSVAGDMDAADIRRRVAGTPGLAHLTVETRPLPTIGA